MPKSKTSEQGPGRNDIARKKKNATAQALFRARRTNYIATLEETVSNLESVVQVLQGSCRESKEETQALELQVSRLKHERREREEYWSNLFWRIHPSNNPCACSFSVRTRSVEPATANAMVTSTGFHDLGYHGVNSSRNFQALDSTDRTNAHFAVFETGRSFHGPLEQPDPSRPHDQVYHVDGLGYVFSEQQDSADKLVGPKTTYRPPTESPFPTSGSTSFNGAPFVEQSQTARPAQDLDYRHGEHPLPGTLSGSTTPSFQPAQTARKVHGQDLGPRRYPIPGTSTGSTASSSLISRNSSADDQELSDSEPLESEDLDPMVSVNIIRAEAFGGLRKRRKRNKPSSQKTSQIVANVLDTRFKQSSTSEGFRLSGDQSWLDARIRFEGPICPIPGR